MDDSLKDKVKDASNSHYGSCNVEVSFSSKEQLRYIMALVRQALEKQTDGDI